MNSKQPDRNQPRAEPKTTPEAHPGELPGAAPRGEHMDFVRERVAADRASGVDGGRVITRFPPEPNGYLHIGHAKSICLNFGIAQEFGGQCHLRFDDTNPTKEETEYVESIQEDVRWLGFAWSGEVRYASQYFEQLFEYAKQLVRKNLAFVCDQTGEEMRRTRGSLTGPGSPSPFRERSAKVNLDLLERMRQGEFPEGARTLRAKIDMGSPNMNMRDPVMYRILHSAHHRTGASWCIYPTYDWAHGLSDAIEGITHSICTLEFENHRPLYEWFLKAIDRLPHQDRAPPRQIEFARLNLTYTVLSKRKLLELVQEKHVAGWDDPRMPTLSGLRRRGFTPAAIRRFCEQIGVAKFNSTVDRVLLENALRDDLNRSAPRAMAVLRPLKVVIENYPQDQVESLVAQNNPEDPAAGSRQIPFGREVWVERDDYKDEAPKDWFRLAPGKEVRLRYAYYVTCQRAVRDPATGEITHLVCTYDPATRGGDSPDGRKVKGTLHWVACASAVSAHVRLYDHLFGESHPESAAGDGDYKAFLNPNSLESITAAQLEPSLAEAQPGSRWQFERLGYFIADVVDSRPGRPVFGRIVTLKDSWAKLEKKLPGGGRQPAKT